MHGLKNVRNRRTDSLSRVGWDQFESLLATFYRGQGYRVDHVGTGGSSARFDGGIDLKLHRADEYIVVQCKHWNAKQVPHNDVHQLLGIMVNEGATGAILITSGEFTAYARDSAAKQGKVQLIDGDALRAMIGPLPEPETRDAAVADRAGAIAVHVGARLLNAAENRIRGNKGSRPRGAGIVASAGSLLLLKVLSFAFACLLVLLAIGFIRDTITGMQVARVAPVSPSAPLPAPTAAASQAITAMPTPSNRAGTAAAQPSGTDSNTCHEVIDWQSGTYIDHCMQATPPKPLSAAEQRELKRKADEAAKVLEATTPEL